MAGEEAEDEMLMRLADGELAGPDAAALRARIAAEPALAARYALFTGTREAAAAAFAPLAAQPVPDRLLAAVLAADRAARPPDSAKVVPLPARRAASWVPLALAASVAALLAAPAGYLLGRSGGEAPMLADPLAGAHGLVVAALESTPSGSRRSAGGATVEPLATHAVAGGVCRDFRLERADAALLGIACRAAEGWRLRAGVVLEGGPAIRPASGDHPAILAVLEQLGAAPPMDAETEAAALRRGWR
jgi:hypothetical protein